MKFLKVTVVWGFVKLKKHDIMLNIYKNIKLCT